MLDVYVYVPKKAVQIYEKYSNVVRFWKDFFC